MIAWTHHPKLDQAHDEIETGRYEPLRITATLREGVLLHDPLHLDALLQYAVVERVMKGERLAVIDGLYAIPTPLMVLLDVNGLPLYASTDFHPIDQHETNTRYLHRRAPDPHMINHAVETRKGRYKDWRYPFRQVVTERISADCVGDAQVIARLLEQIVSVGKKSNLSANVETWTVEKIDAFSLYDEDETPLRPIPVQASERLDLLPAFVSFTPPYWHGATRAWCIGGGR